MPRKLSLSLAAMLLACAAVVTPAQAAESQRTYTVKVKAEHAAEGTRAVSAQMAAAYGGTVVADSASGDSFVLRISEARARVLGADPRVSSVKLMPAPQAVPETVKWSSGVSYTYDGAGDISKIGEDGFTYDSAGRLTTATINGVKRKYSYDGFGNRTDCSENGANDCQVLKIDTTAKLNRFRTSDATYDAAGNVQSIPLFGHTYSYDAFNMMTKDVSAATREFVYTADDERLATYTVGSSWRWTVRETSGKVLREFSSTSASGGWKWEKDYVYRDGSLLASRQPEGNGGTTTTYHYHLDHLGTPRRVTDQGDQAVGNHDYYAYGPSAPGGTAEKSPTALKYTGHERDAWSGESFDTLDYMHARYYSASLGRFLSPDRVSGSPARPQSWNRYEYAAGNPLRFLDPDGLAELDFHIYADPAYGYSAAKFAGYLFGSEQRMAFSQNHSYQFTSKNWAQRDLHRSLSTPGALVVYYGHAGFVRGSPKPIGLDPMGHQQRGELITNSQLTAMLKESKAAVVLIAGCSSAGCISGPIGGSSAVVTVRPTGSNPFSSTNYTAQATSEFVSALIGAYPDGELRERGTVGEAIKAANELLKSTHQQYEFVLSSGNPNTKVAPDP